MRRFAALALILLLALRGLLGDAMAMGLAPMPADTHTAHTTAAHDSHGSHHAGQQAYAAHPPAHCAGGDGPHDRHAACSACGICHSAFPAPAFASALPSAAGGTPHRREGARFASAPPAQAIKPPIS